MEVYAINFFYPIIMLFLRALLLQAVCTTETCTSKTVIYLALCNKCKFAVHSVYISRFKGHLNPFTRTSHLVILLCCGIKHVVFTYTLNYCISVHWILDNLLSLVYGQVFCFMEPIQGKYLRTDFIQIP